jgi:glycosyltransferase involved in cell wall biosynthesis
MSLLISVVIPVHNGASTLPRVLDAMKAANPAPGEIILVDDGSTDESAGIAREAGVCLLSLEQNLGAAIAKNRGASTASGDILFFTDADIIVPHDIFARLGRAFQDANCDAVVGLLDQDIPERNFATQFKNLWMNFTYARFANRARIGLFYTSVAAIRRERFVQLGGFDEHYRGASVAEDTEFGQRAWSKGITIKLDPGLRVVHLKEYALGGLLREDLVRSAALTRLRLRKWGQPFFTSVPTFYQVAVPTAYLTAFALIWGALIASPTFALIALTAIIAFYALNSPLIRFLARMRGYSFAIRSCVFLPFDTFISGMGILLGAADFVRGRRY